MTPTRAQYVRLPATRLGAAPPVFARGSGLGKRERNDQAVHKLGIERIHGYSAFYPSLLACAVDSIPVVAQPGRFYGGWVTPEVIGPFKGETGSEGW